MRSRLISRSLLFNLDAHRANLPNLIAGATGMFVNNVIFLTGIWAMLFAGKAANARLVPYFVALCSVVMLSWGAVNFFFGGLRALGEYITEGALEPMLATPRDPILLAAISRSSPIALGDLVMGVMGVVAIAVKLGLAMALRCSVAAVISAVGFAALFVFAGAISFFVPRGNHVGALVIETTISLSSYPTGKMFAGAGRIVLLLTPAAATAILPVDAVESASVLDFALALAAAMIFAGLALAVFRLGVRRYRAVSLIGARS
jgi:ABC-type uncharacterized transport system permease subunit